MYNLILCTYIRTAERYVTLNVHGLVHLPEVVQNLGPLWAHSCFPFESANGDILKLFHGSSGVEKQVCADINFSLLWTQLLLHTLITFIAASHCLTTL